jgi:hypothetical protein
MSATHRVQEWKSWCKAQIVGWKNSWKEHWGLPVSGVSAGMAVVFFVYRITPWFSDTALFWLKLGSFIITAILGAIGVVTDFRDVNKNLTRPGKINLAGLALAAFIGIIAQKAEYDSTTKASAEAKKSLSDLNEENQTVLKKVQTVLETSMTTNSLTRGTLNQVNRNLEMAGDTIVVNYEAEIPLRAWELENSTDPLREQIEELAANGRYSDEHSSIEVRGAKEDQKVYVATFDKESILMPQNLLAKGLLANPVFVIFFHKVQPVVSTNCLKRPSSDALYEWDETLTAARTPKFHVDETQIGTLMLTYSTSLDFVFQSSHFEAVFKVRENPGNMLSTLDFSRAYMRIAIPLGSKVRFSRFVVKIGQRPFVVPIKQLVQDSCDGFTYRLPKISPN